MTCPVVDRVPARQPADRDDDVHADQEEDDGAPRRPDQAGPHQEATLPRGLVRRTVDRVLRSVLGGRRHAPALLPDSRSVTTARRSPVGVSDSPNVFGITPGWKPPVTRASGSTIDSRTNASSGCPACSAAAARSSRSGPIVPVRSCGLERVASPAAGVGEHRLPVGCATRAAGRRLLLPRPGGEVGLREHPHRRPHRGVAEPAELGADEGVAAHARRGDDDRRLDAGQHVLLLAHLRDPEGVDHVGGGHLELDPAIDREHELVRPERPSGPGTRTARRTAARTP